MKLPGNYDTIRIISLDLVPISMTFADSTDDVSVIMTADGVILPHQGKSLSWFDLPDVDSISNIGTSSDGYGSIGMNRFNYMRSSVGYIDLRLASGSTHYLVTHFIVMETTFSVLVDQSLVNLHLTSFCNGNDVSNNRNVQKHIASKYQGSRRVVLQPGVGADSRSLHRGGEGPFHYFFSVFVALRRTQLHQRSERVRDGLVHTFNDSITLRITRSGVSVLDSVFR